MSVFEDDIESHVNHHGGEIRDVSLEKLPANPGAGLGGLWFNTVEGRSTVETVGGPRMHAYVDELGTTPPPTVANPSAEKDPDTDNVVVDEVGVFPADSLTPIYTPGTDVLALVDTATGKTVVSGLLADWRDSAGLPYADSAAALLDLIDITTATPVPDFVDTFNTALTT